MLMAQKPTTAAAATTTPPAATHRRFCLRRVLNEGLGSEGMKLAVLSGDVPGNQPNLVFSYYASLTIYANLTNYANLTAICRNDLPPRT
jgi:hypothetical protein